VPPELESRTSGLFPGVARVYHGHDGFKRYWHDFRGLWEEIELVPERLLDHGDRVVVFGRFKARGREGINVTRELGVIFTIRDGLGTRMETYPSGEEALEAVGLASEGRRSSAARPGGGVMDTASVPDTEIEVIRRAWSAASRGDENAFRLELHPAIEVVPFGAAMEGKSYRGPDEVIRWWREEALANWEIFQTIPEDFRRVGGKILVTGRWHAWGKTSGVELEMPATWIVEVREGKIIFWQTYTDRTEALEAVGLRE
jgi:ketosteroid isomerase-like protein